MKKVIRRVVNGKSFKLLDFRVFDNYPDDDSSVDSQKVAEPESPTFTIQMFGINEKGETACCVL